MTERIIDLEAADHTSTSVIIRYRGVVTSFSRERLEQLLRREEAYLELCAAGSAGPGAASPGSAPKPAPVSPSLAPPTTPRPSTDGTISHAGLSMRIKRIYNYSQAAKVLRASHAEHLAVILAQFDWQLPDYPNSQLDFQLREIAGWERTEPETRALIEGFLVRYREARYRKK